MEKRYIAIVLFIIPTLLASCCLSVNSSDRSFIVLGDSKIELHPNDTVGVQIDRVVRDIHWDSPVFGINVPANRTPAVSEIVPYMEGARTKEMMDWAKIEVMPLTPARAQPIWSAKQEGKMRCPLLLKSRGGKSGHQRAGYFLTGSCSNSERAPQK